MKRLEGFTLVELIIILVIVGILAIAVIPKGTAKSAIRLEAACQKVANDLRYAQQMSMAQQVRFGLSFDTSDESYFVYRETTSAKATDPHTQGDLELDFDDMSEFNDIQITSTNLTNDKIEFKSIGAPCNASGTNLTSEGVVTLATKDALLSKTVRIEPETGKVKVQ